MHAWSNFPAVRRPHTGRLLFAALATTTAALAQFDEPGTGRSRGDLPMRGGDFFDDRVPVFFPPTPPPLGRALPRTSPPAGRLAAPPEMAAYVNEPFYPVLATRLALKRLPDRLKARVEEYRRTKVALLVELRTELERLRPFEPEARATALSALAVRQAAPLRALEESAEALRRDLGGSDYNWNTYRQWHLGDNERRGFSPVEVAQVMRAAAYYQDALLPAQRRLLREISLELLNAGENPEAAAANHPYLFFPPEPARVSVPPDLPSQVAAQIARYETRKSELKKELYDAVFAYDGRRFAFFRPNPLKALAERQKAPLAELDALAEEIRRGLAGREEVVPVVERTPLSPILQNRLNTLLQDIGSAQRRAIERIEAILAEARDLPMQASYRFEAEGLRFVVIPSRASRGGGAINGETQARIIAVRDRVSQAAAEYDQRLAVLLAERDAIRAETGAALGVKETAKLDQALGTAVRVANARETESVYREYRQALFEPGLSPEQRRLLFDGAIERLELPLPRGEMQPFLRSPNG
jgi:hypothetical protein